MDSKNKNNAFGDSFEYQFQKVRIKKILEDTVYKLKILSHLPEALDNDGQILRKFLNKTEADFIVMVCQDQAAYTKLVVENRSDIELICNTLEKINLYEKKGSATLKKAFYSSDFYDIYIAYVVEIIFKCEPLLSYLESLENSPDSLMQDFIEAMIQLQKVILDKLEMTAEEEIKRENDLKSAYRSSMILSNNIQELEEILEKQRQEIGKEQDRKEEILQDLAEKTETLKEKCEEEINKIITESETKMMKDYNKSIEKQEELAAEAASSTKKYESLLEEHLSQEKLLRAKRLKIEAQLASWVAKYDQDIGEKQAEFDELEKTYNEEKEQLEILQEKFDEQELEYNVLMKEKEEEEARIREEKAWIFLQNRSARRIQRYWRAYRQRKLARKKARKSRKKGSAEGGKKAKAKKSPKAKNKRPKQKEKQKGESPTLKGGPDPNALLEGKFGDSILGEIKSKEAFDKKDVEVDLLND